MTSIQSGGAPAAIMFPNSDKTFYLTDSDQNLIQREGPKVFRYDFNYYVYKKVPIVIQEYQNNILYLSRYQG